MERNQRIQTSITNEEENELASNLTKACKIEQSKISKMFSDYCTYLVKRIDMLKRTKNFCIQW